jgi:hypothetical protein
MVSRPRTFLVIPVKYHGPPGHAAARDRPWHFVGPDASDVIAIEELSIT